MVQQRHIFRQESNTIKAILFGAKLLMSDVLYHQIQGLEKYVLFKLLTFKIEVLTAFFLIIASLVSPHIYLLSNNQDLNQSSLCVWIDQFLPFFL